MMSVFQNCFRFWIGALASTLRRRQLRENPMPNVEVAGNCRPSRVAYRELRNLHQAGFNCINQPEIAHNPWERAVRCLPNSPQEIRRCRKIDAEIDATQFLDSVQTFDPHRGFFEKFLRFLFLTET